LAAVEEKLRTPCGRGEIAAVQSSVIPAGYCLPAVRLLAFCSSKPSAQRLSPCAAATGACALRRHLSGDLHPAPKKREPLLRVRS